MDRLARTTARIAVALATLLTAVPAAAATITVDTTTDDRVANGNCTLREAISAANLDAAEDACTAGSGADVIQIPSGTYTITPGGGENGNFRGDFDISHALSLVGTGATRPIIDAQAGDRIFDVTGAEPVSISGLKLTGGAPVDPSPANLDPGQSGGAIQNAGGTLTLDNMVISGNAAGPGVSEGGVITAATVGGSGGAVASLGPVTITDSQITGNHAGGGGNGFSLGGGAPGGAGGAISVAGALTLARTLVSNNQAGSGGGGGTLLCAGGPGGSGGAISAAGEVSVTDSTVSSNSAGAGGLPGSPCTTTGGPGSAGGSGGALNIAGAGPLTITRSVLATNTAGAGSSGNTGAVPPAGTGGSGGSGGALSLSGVLNATITDSDLSYNSTGAGGGSPNVAAGKAGSGAALLTSSTGLVTIQRGTFAANTLGVPGSGTPNGDAGRGTITVLAGAAKLVNSTLSSNTSGALTTVLPGLAELTNVSVAQNSGGAGALEAGGAITLANSILEENAPANCVGLIVDGGHNVSNTATCPADTVLDPLLGLLLDNGGLTKTRAIFAGSSAIDLIPAGDPTCPATDQRGIRRPQGSGCDAGAFEFVPSTTTGDGGTDTSTGGGTQPPGGSGTTPPPADVPAGDKTPPVVKLLLKKQKLRTALKKGFKCAFSTNEPGSASAKLGKYASGRVTIKKAGTQKLVCKFTKKAKKKLAKAKKVKLKLVLVVKDAAGNATTKRATVLLKR